jgi:Flp pilus assembly protein TadD
VCARAFEADPNNATLALGIAHAAHVRGRFADAAVWARRALALDPNRAEAYVLIARADARAGRDEDARAAYRRYLDLAPRGWHKAEARTALAGAR